jgi:hypothetical protein
MIVDFITTYALKLALGALAAVALFAGVQTLRLANAKTDLANANTAKVTLEASVAQYEKAAKDRAEQEAKAKAERERIAQENRDAIAGAEKERAQAEADAKYWYDKWHGRSNSCAIALGQVEQACKADITTY